MIVHLANVGSTWHLDSHNPNLVPYYAMAVPVPWNYYPVVGQIDKTQDKNG